MNDDHVSKSSLNQVLGQSAYIIFYNRIYDSPSKLFGKQEMEAQPTPMTIDTPKPKPTKVPPKPNNGEPKTPSAPENTATKGTNATPKPLKPILKKTKEDDLDQIFSSKPKKDKVEPTSEHISKKLKVAPGAPPNLKVVETLKKDLQTQSAETEPTKTPKHSNSTPRPQIINSPFSEHLMSMNSLFEDSSLSWDGMERESEKRNKTLYDPLKYQPRVRDEYDEEYDKPKARKFKTQEQREQKMELEQKMKDMFNVRAQQKERKRQFELLEESGLRKPRKLSEQRAMLRKRLKSKVRPTKQFQ
jgi:hypothetical protein